MQISLPNRLMKVRMKKAKKGGATGIDGITMKVCKFFCKNMHGIEMVSDFMQQKSTL